MTILVRNHRRLLNFLSVCLFAISIANSASADSLPCPADWDDIDWSAELRKSLSPLTASPTDPRFRTFPAPVAPKQLYLRPRFKPVGCNREYQVRGKNFVLDSNTVRDADGLRARIASVPAAIHELDLYQATQAKVARNAYIGTAGVAIVIGSLIAAAFIRTESRNADAILRTDKTRNLIRTVGIVTGGALTVGTVFYSLGLLRGNEQHLRNAVQNYNEAYPDEPITLTFSTGILF